MKRILPSYPLFVKDPNFSIWQGADTLNEKNAETWFGAQKKLYGFLKTDGKTYCFMGNAGDFSALCEKADQTALSVTAFSTDYAFQCGNTTLKLRFVSPLPLTNLEILDMPVCYMEYEIEGGKDAEISLFVNRNIAYNELPQTQDKCVCGGVVALKGFESAFLGLSRQLPLSNTYDRIGADWGYFYLAGEKAYLADEKELCAYLANAEFAYTASGHERYITAQNKAQKGAILLGYDDRVSIDYFGKYCKGYYLENHTIYDALETVWHDRASIENELSAFENKLFCQAEKYGQAYKNVLIASLRQSIAAHKLVRDENGEVLWLSKECGSNGCIATVDVSYPSMPLYLLYNPELVKGMMRPILKFSRMPVWTYDFAPHDVGTYPACCGQVYGWKQEEGNKYHGRIKESGLTPVTKTHFPVYMLPANYDAFDFDKQMPVEECANMLVMFLGVYKADQDIEFFKQSADLCAKWVEYLVKYGLKPANQLCTDDFAGHLANNVNLAIKATVGIAAYAELLKASGEKEPAQKYRKIAEDFAKEIAAFADGKTHLPITWDSGDTTFSLKYNFAFDKIFELGLFKQELFEREVDCYLQKAERYGTPLDNRKMYTKSDWLMWSARLTDDMEKRAKMIEPLNLFLQETPDRIPFGDWFETDNGKFNWFRARTVQGGCFILLM